MINNVHQGPSRGFDAPPLHSGTFQLQLALELPVDVLLVELGIGALKVKVLLKLHGSVSADVEASSAAVTAPPTAPVSRSSGRHYRAEETLKGRTKAHV